MALSDNPDIVRAGRAEEGCAFGRWSRTLPDKDRQTLLSWLQDRTVSNPAIVEAINSDDDYPETFRAGSVAYHRRQDCRCGSL